MNYRHYKIGFFILLIIIVIMMIIGPISNHTGGRTIRDSSHADSVDTMKHPRVFPEKRHRPPMPPSD